MTETITLSVGGRKYEGWTSIRVTRGIDRCATDFDIEVTERWATQPTPWQIQPFQPCTVSIGADVVLTGYVDDYLPRYDANNHSVRIRGRSKTEDLIDCAPQIKGGQFSGYTLSAIATSIAGLFDIQVLAQAAGASNVFGDATMERGETAFAFLERLATLSAVLLADDEQGRLLLTNAGATQAAGRLIEGQNILSATGVLSGSRRHSQYTLLGQAGMDLAGAGTAFAGFGGGYEPGGSLPPPPAAVVQTQLSATAIDGGVPRFRPRVTLADGQLTVAQLQQRANWMRAAAFGASVRADIAVAGWRQPDGTLWRINQIVPVNSPRLGVNQDLLVARVEYMLSDRDGATTRLRVAPIEAYVPDPASVRIHKKKSGGGGAQSWAGFGGGS